VRGPYDTTPQLVNDLDLRVVENGSTHLGNGGAAPDRLNNVEVVSLDEPQGGLVEISIDAFHLGFGTRQSYALVVTGDVTLMNRLRAVRR
jgi:hypothetical protein